MSHERAALVRGVAIIATSIPRSLGGSACESLLWRRPRGNRILLHAH